VIPVFLLAAMAAMGGIEPAPRPPRKPYPLPDARDSACRESCHMFRDGCPGACRMLERAEARRTLTIEERVEQARQHEAWRQEQLAKSQRAAEINPAQPEEARGCRGGGGVGAAGGVVSGASLRGAGYLDEGPTEGGDWPRQGRSSRPLPEGVRGPKRRWRAGETS
jgi:hypothetical protein